MGDNEVIKPDAPGEPRGNDFRGRIRVFGKNIFAGPLLDTADAETIVMYDDDGVPCVILARQIDNLWEMGTCQDSDWEAVKQRFGVF